MTNRGPVRRRAVPLSALVLLLFALVPCSATAQPPPAYAPDSILVRFKGSTRPDQKTLAHAWIGTRVDKSFSIVDGLQAVRIPSGMRVKDAVELYRRHPAVLYAEPNWIVRTQATPNDPRLGELWALNNRGQTGGVPGADIDALAAWNRTTGSNTVVVVVIDTGIDYDHQDLSANMFRNERDCNSNGIDDDGNGHVDDCFGIDTVNGDSDPMDDNSHGTHVAGTIGAAGNNGVGVVGVNWAVQLMACKFLNEQGFGDLVGALQCLEYVKLMRDRGVNIVATNNSWSGGGFSQAMFDAIEAHLQRGILFVAAAANNGTDNDTTPVYPANYDLPNVISVAATTRTDALASFSDFGRRTVHLGAPGAEILSTVPSNGYATFNGTSMATPHVTGLAALLAADDPSRDWRAIKNLILAGGDPIPVLANTITRRRLNARGAIDCSNSTVLSRHLPIGDVISGVVGTPIDLAVLHINCASPNGSVAVGVSPGGQSVVLADDGQGADRAAGDGTYSGRWTPPTPGTYTMSFPDGSVVTAQILTGYTAATTPFVYRTITGTNLNLTDDSSASIASPFPIRFGGGSFDTVFVSSNGNVNFASPFTEWPNVPIPTGVIATLVAPWWDDLVPQPASGQNVFWAVTGTSPNRELVIEWRDITQFNCLFSGSVKFQLVLFEGSSNLLFNYADTVFGAGCFADRGGSATVGVQVNSGTGTQYSFDTPSLSDDLALLWTTAPLPTMSVSPSSRNFGSVPLGSSEDRSFTVLNGGGGVVSGSATTSAPFSVVSGGAYSLSTGQSQQVTVRFTPTATGMHATSVTFSGSGGATRAVTGSGIPVSPIAPLGLAAATTSPSRLDLAWQDPNGNEVESRIERKLGATGTFGQIATLGANVTVYADTGLAPGSTYVYRVRACNAVGCSDYSNEATATTPVVPVSFALSVTVRGSAAGTVTSSPAGISCAPSCSASFPAGTLVTLTAAPGTRASFKGWSGGCSGTTTACTVTLNGARSVTATFSMVFTDATSSDLLPDSTSIKATHFTELLGGINAAQPGTNLSWPSLAPAVGGLVLAIHARTLRQALGLTAVSPGAVIAAQHINEIRLKIRSLE